ncbi:MAG: T9SS type A sorting domain-containing protein [Flavobacteriales bacterium]|nr:T9SS type A sorting domain-containing protein [Flavobacteriales bacterium]
MHYRISDPHKNTFINYFLTLLLLFPISVFCQNPRLDTTFDIYPGADAGINELIIQPDDKVIVAGMFKNFKGKAAGRIIRMQPNGGIDSTWIRSAGGADSDIRGMALQPDGKVLVGGIFSMYDGMTANRLVRLNSDGSIDTTFEVDSGPNNEVQGITANNNRAVIRGFFNTYQGTLVPSFAVIKMNGSLDNSFNLPSESFLFINDFHILSNDKLYLGGNFTTYNGQTVNRIVRLNQDGSIDTTFKTGSGLNGAVRRLFVQNNGDVLVAGTFTSYKGASVSGLIRLQPNGDRDTSLNAAVPSLATIDAITTDASGRIYMAGSDAGKLFLKRLLPNGSEDTGFNISGTGFNGNITQLAHQSNNKLIVTGFFSLYQNQQAERVARMFTDSTTASIETRYIKDRIVLFPNPCTDMFSLNTNETIRGEIYLRIRDLYGRQVYDGLYNMNDKLGISASHWLPGIYLVEVQNTLGKRVVLRLMRQ